MGAPFTQAEIQAEIDACKTLLRESMTAQQYSYDQGPVGQFGVQKGDVEKIKKVLDYWINMMKEYFPDAFAASTTPIRLYEIGYKQG